LIGTTIGTGLLPDCKQLIPPILLACYFNPKMTIAGMEKFLRTA
jgi:hypothetical protein